MRIHLVSNMFMLIQFNAQGLTGINDFLSFNSVQKTQLSPSHIQLPPMRPPPPLPPLRSDPLGADAVPAPERADGGDPPPAGPAGSDGDQAGRPTVQQAGRLPLEAAAPPAPGLDGQECEEVGSVDKDVGNSLGYVDWNVS